MGQWVKVEFYAKVNDMKELSESKFGELESRLYDLLPGAVVVDALVIQEVSRMEN